ncbi:MAG: hypothetical protein OEN56_10170 [Gemmatimonadota bacterium]|nr:hypothetical protein [Gemmatimonadota bacterium]
MTKSGQDSRDWRERVGAWIGARWRWLVLGVLFLFVLNNLVGVIAGAAGLILFAHQLAGRVLGARRVLERVQRVVGDSDDRGEET